MRLKVFNPGDRPKRTWKEVVEADMNNLKLKGVSE